MLADAAPPRPPPTVPVAAMTFNRFPDNRSSDGESEAVGAYMTETGEGASTRRLMGDDEATHQSGAGEDYEG